MTLGRCPWSIFCSRSTPPRVHSFRDRLLWTPIRASWRTRQEKHTSWRTRRKRNHQPVGERDTAKTHLLEEKYRKRHLLEDDVADALLFAGTVLRKVIQQKNVLGGRDTAKMHRLEDGIQKKTSFGGQDTGKRTCWRMRSRMRASSWARPSESARSDCPSRMTRRISEA